MRSMEQHRRAMEIFQQALDMPPEVQSECIQALCAGDEALLQEVRELLKSHQEAGFLSEAIQSKIAGMAEAVVQAPLRDALALIGKKLKGRYLIEKELGSGGMGRVFQARDEEVHERLVVIKVLLETSEPNEWLLRKFSHEGEALARIDHPNVVKVLDRGTYNRQPFLVMEFIQGEPLTRLIQRGMVPLNVAVRIVTSICQALNAAHHEGIVHRDLKPDNVMLWKLKDGTQTVKLIDFGVARIANPHSAERTTTAFPVGTLPYMAAEILSGGEATVACDVYALGVITYELLTGQRPFQVEATTQNAAMFQYWNAQNERCFVRPRELRPEIPKPMESVVLKALAFHPEDRFHNVLQFEREFSASGALPAPADPKSEIRVVPPSPFHTAETAVFTSGKPDSPASQADSSNQPERSSRGDSSSSSGLDEAQPHLSVPSASHAVPAAPPAAPALEIAPSKEKPIPVGLLVAGITLVAVAGMAVWLWGGSRFTQAGPTHSADRSTLMPLPMRAALPFESVVSLKRATTGQTSGVNINQAEQNIECQTGDEIRLRVNPAKAGYVYILSESPRPTEELLPRYTILFPSQQDNHGSARFGRGQHIDLPEPTARQGLKLAGDKGTEKLWIVWADESVAVLETVRTLANPRDNGAIRKREQVTAVRDLLEAASVSSGDRLANQCLKFEHH
ncbi:MAG: protein kinase [Blastocatellia bacterium]|nr:protein kinase [Blastocatellia bacterium]